MPAMHGPPKFPLADYLGLKIEVLEKGSSSASLDVDEKHLNPNGVVHGATIFTMVDTGMGAATFSALEEGKHCASIEVHIRFLRAVSDGKLRAETEVIKSGSRVVQLKSDVYGPENVHIASATGSFAIIEVSS